MRVLILFGALVLTAVPALAAPPHVHGVAHLEIAIEGPTLAIHLETPLDGLLGFEHAPHDAAERQAVSTMRATLAQPERLFALPAAAACQAGNPQLASPIFDDHAASGHLDLDADYRWQCANPAALRAVDTRLFAEFPRFRKIKVELVGPDGQKSGELSAQQPRFAW
jgi:hypothetical protein